MFGLRSTTSSCALLLSLGIGAPLAAQTVSDGFDDVSAPVAFMQIFPGFQNGPVVLTGGARYVGGVILDDLLFDQAASSGGNLLAGCDTCTLGDPEQTGLPGAITGAFGEPQDRVRLDVINGVGFGSGTYQLTAFDASGTQLAVDSVVVGPAGGPNSTGELEVSAPGIRRFVVGTSLPTGYTFAIDTVERTRFESEFVDLGQALPGTSGASELSGFGSLVAGEPLQVSLTGALPGATSFLVLGLTQLDAPFKQGVLVPSADVIFPGQIVGGGGALVLEVSTPAGLPTATTLFLQHWTLDPGGPAGFAASNGLALTTP